MYDDRIRLDDLGWFEKNVDSCRIFVDVAQPWTREQPYSWTWSALAMLQINRIYARRHNYEFVFQRQGFDDYPPFWVKVKMIQDALLKGHEYVIWLDTDACIELSHHKTSLKSIFDELGASKCIIYSSNQPDWPGDFCAGVIMFRNCQTTLDFVRDWLAAYDPTAWSKDGKTNEWKCNSEWAGEKYEQGAGATLLKSIEYREYAKQVAWQTLNNHNYKRSENSFTMHFAGNYKLYIEPYILLNIGEMD